MPDRTSVSPPAKGVQASHFHAFTYGKGFFVHPCRGPRTGESQDLREEGQGSRRGWSKCAVLSRAGSDVPGQTGPWGLGVAVPSLWEFPPVGVIGNRLRSRQGMHSTGVLHTEWAGRGPMGLLQGRYSRWLGHPRTSCVPTPVPSPCIQDLTQPSCQHSLAPPHVTDLNTEGQ